MPAQTWTPGQVLTAAELKTVTDMLPYPATQSASLNPCVAGTFYRCQPTGTITLTLPTPTAGAVIAFTLDAAQGNTAVIQHNAAESIYGSDVQSNVRGVTTITLAIPDAYLCVIADGTNWHIIGQDGVGGGWVAPSYTNSWVDFGAPYHSVGYRLVGTRVFLRGLMKTGTINTAAFTLAAGYRPLANTHFAVVSNGLFGYATIGSNGVVTPTVGSNADFSLDGISFDTV